MKKHIPDVLVLNRNHAALHICDWQKSMSLIYQDAARALDRDGIVYEFPDWLVFSEIENDYPVIHTTSKRIAVPEIIVLMKYDRLPTRETKYSRQTLFHRDRHTCAYCGQAFRREDLTVDHIKPRAQGGTTTWLNTITACKPCNGTKANRTPEEASMHLRFKPKKPVWLSPLMHVKADHPCQTWLRYTNQTVTD